MKRYFKRKKEEGFTIVETLVAITILMISIAGPLTIAQRSLMSSIFAKDQAVAAFLAQDAMEYLKNARSNSIATFSSWLNNVANSCTRTYPCSISTIDLGYVLPFIQPSSTALPAIYDLYTPDIGVYKPNPTSSFDAEFDNKSIYSRKFYVDVSNSDGSVNISNPGDEATIVVIVEWQNAKYYTNRYELQSQIFNMSL